MELTVLGLGVTHIHLNFCIHFPDVNCVCTGLLVFHLLNKNAIKTLLLSILITLTGLSLLFPQQWGIL